MASGISDSILFIASNAMSRPWNLRKLPTHPITKRLSSPSRRLTSSPWRSGENISGSTPFGVTRRRASGTPSRPTCSAISTEPQATTSAALSKGASAVRSRSPCQPGRFTPQPAASWTMRAGVKTTNGRSSAFAALTPASWKRSCRCQMKRTSSERHGPSSPASLNRRASRAFRASLSPVLTVVGTLRRSDAGTRWALEGDRVRCPPHDLLWFENALGGDDPRLPPEPSGRGRPAGDADPGSHRSRLTPGPIRVQEEDTTRAHAAVCSMPGGKCMGRILASMAAIEAVTRLVVGRHA